MNDNEGEVYEVLGHLCPGLTEFLKAVTYGCTPSITPEGVITACDDSNPVTIRFCPFCGARL